MSKELVSVFDEYNLSVAIVSRPAGSPIQSLQLLQLLGDHVPALNVIPSVILVAHENLQRIV
jgi:hypothetical protein